MIGGTVVQKSGSTIEVLDDHSFDRCWRVLENPDEVREGDSIWWQNHRGFLSRAGEFRDRKIGLCLGCNPHGRKSNE
jgi:hypothetical protein